MKACNIVIKLQVPRVQKCNYCILIVEERRAEKKKEFGSAKECSENY
jgi:hypothetical protein